jgi:hypothetical protein
MHICEHSPLATINIEVKVIKVGVRHLSFENWLNEDNLAIFML